MSEDKKDEVISEKNKDIKALKYIAGICFILFLISVSYQYYHFVNHTDCGCAIKYFGDTDTSNNQTNLLFVYDPVCIHCINTVPIINDFEKKHNEISVIRVKYSELNDKQKDIVGVLKGVPTIIIYNNFNKSEILGEVSLDELEMKYKLFIGEKQ